MRRVTDLSVCPARKIMVTPLCTCLRANCAWLVLSTHLCQELIDKLYRLLDVVSTVAFSLSIVERDHLFKSEFLEEVLSFFGCPDAIPVLDVVLSLNGVGPFDGMSD